jgi:hypothetical protein
MRPTSLALFLAALACGGTAADSTPFGDDTWQPEGAPGSATAPQETARASGTSGPVSVAFERLDASAECDGLVPDRVPEPVVVRRGPEAGAACAGGISDGTGAVAIAVRDASGEVRWRAYRADGSEAGTFTADLPLLPQPAGWQALLATRPEGATDPEIELLAVGPDGAVARRETISPDPTRRSYFGWDLSADPAGGSVAVVRSTHNFGNHWSDVTVHRFDADGAPRWPGGVSVLSDPSPLEPMFLGVGATLGGDTLLLTQNSAFLDVTWLDGNGHGVGGSVMHEYAHPLVGEGLRHELELFPLLDGSSALRADGTWRRRYDPREPASTPLPPWLAARADATVRVTRGGAGYVTLPAAGEASPGCTQVVELVAASGRVCGRAVFREEGTSCTSGAIDQGWDGTVVQQSGRDACTYRWWPRLLGS